jgi:hypothetical protein
VLVDQSTGVAPKTEDIGIDPLEFETASSEPSEDPVISQFTMPPLISTFVPSIHGIITLPMRAVRVYTYYLTLPVRYMLSFTPLMSATSPHAKITSEPKTSSSEPEIYDISEKDVDHMSSPTFPENIAADQNALMEVNPVCV